ncbi:hypothetical protein HOLleu_40982 [Holothuria leucospilota]|uniref:MADF domain-containing protein n=1 Tax=Holothuria leucospilota TaxID=206669 RepID=A0A9Q0YE77_HOLLE|nr:hypothetical protein HOLleu_40982 [Holothuria leucospilota]
MPRRSTSEASKKGTKAGKGRESSSVSSESRPQTPEQPGQPEVPLRQEVVVDVHQPDEAQSEEGREVQETLSETEHVPGDVEQSNEVEDPELTEDSERSRNARATNRINNEALEDNLVEWLRENPILWDSAHRDFRLTKKKENMWVEKAKDLDKNGDFLKGWYKDLRDQFVKLRKEKSGAGARRLTYREEWVLQRFQFLAHTVKYRKKKSCAIRSVAATKALESGDLEQAERIAAMDRETIDAVDDPEPGPSGEGPIKKKKRVDSPSLVDVTRQLSTAQTQVLQLQQQLMEPTDKRVSYLEYFKSVVKDITDEEWNEYHSLSVELEFKWLRNARERRQQQPTSFQHPVRPTSASPTSSEIFPPPPPWQWRQQPPQHSDATPWRRQSQDFMAAYNQQQLINPPHQQQQWTYTATHDPPSATMMAPSQFTRLTSTPIPAKESSSQGTASTAQVVSRAMFTLNDQADANLTTESLPVPFSDSTIRRELGDDTPPTPQDKD